MVSTATPQGCVLRASRAARSSNSPTGRRAVPFARHAASPTRALGSAATMARATSATTEARSATVPRASAMTRAVRASIGTASPPAAVAAAQTRSISPESDCSDTVGDPESTWPRSTTAAMARACSSCVIARTT